MKKTKKIKDELSNLIIQSLPIRFSNEEYLENIGKSNYEKFSSLATDITKGAKSKDARKKLRGRQLKYDPYEWGVQFIDQTHNMESQYIDDIPIQELILLYIDGASNYFDFSIYDEAFTESEFYMSEEDLENWYNIPEKKADGSPIYDRFAFLELALDIFVFNYSVGGSLRKFLLAQKEAEYRFLCRSGKVDRANESYCEEDGYLERLEDIQKEIDKSREKASRVVNRYPTASPSYEQRMKSYRQKLKKYPMQMEEYESKIKEIDTEERKARKLLWESQKKKLDKTPFNEMREAIPKPEKPREPKYFESTVQQKLGRDTYVILLDFIGRFLAGIEDRLILTPISKEDAFAYIKKNHSALPDANPRGLMMVLAVQDTDGKIGAVATINTPTGRWDLVNRGEDFDHMNVIELTRVASDGSIKGASSMLTGRAIDLLPFLKRGDPNKKDLFVTYSLDSEEGSTYRALKDKGLRPTAFIKGQKPQGARKGSDVKKNLGNIDKIRWEAGSGAIEANWDLLDLVGKKKDEE